MVFGRESTRQKDKSLEYAVELLFKHSINARTTTQVFKSDVIQSRRLLTGQLGLRQRSLLQNGDRSVGGELPEPS
jgi:hypothetical protein